MHTRRRAVILGIVAGLFVAGWFDHHTSEYDPHHVHLAPGLLGVALDLGIIPHEHAFARAHSHGAEAPLKAAVAPTSGTQVVPAVVLATGDKTGIALLLWPVLVLAVTARSELFRFGSTIWLPGVYLAVPVPPPRPS